MKSKRLQALATLVDGSKDIIDVGCEGATLDIYLVKIKDIKAIGVDINDNSIKLARENISAANLTNKIEIIKNNSLNGIDCTNKIVIIAGLGTKSILKILSNNYPQELIIITHNDLPLLRKRLCKIYTIEEELVVNENDKYYVIIKFIRGYKKYKPIEEILGPIIIKRKNSNDLSYLNYFYLKQKKQYNKIPNRFLIKKIKNKILLRKIELYLK